MTRARTYVREMAIVGIDEVKQNLLETGKSLRLRLREVLEESGAELLTTAQGLVRMRTGKLKSRLGMVTFDRPDGVTVVVAARKFYARFIERGTGPVTEDVMGYWRRVRARDVFLAGRKKARAMGIARVRPFQRFVHTYGHPFLIGPFESRRTAILARINAVLAEATREG